MATGVTKSMWVDWKSNPVTREFMIQINEWKEQKVAELFSGRTSTERQDREVVGEVRGVERAMLVAMEEFQYLQEDDNSD